MNCFLQNHVLYPFYTWAKLFKNNCLKHNLNLIFDSCSEILKTWTFFQHFLWSVSRIRLVRSPLAVQTSYVFEIDYHTY